jgi:hypothetical protein
MLDSRQPPAADLERALLRHGVTALTADRAQCADCGRTPLEGERVHVYEPATVVCALCSRTRRGSPVGQRPVRHSEHGLAVRRKPRIAA